MKRILLAAGPFPPDIGGPATYAKILVEELPRRGIEVEVVHFKLVSRYPKVLRHVIYFFLVVLRGRRADCVLALDPVSTGLPAFIAARVLRTRYILRVGGDYAWEQGTQRFGIRESLDEFVRYQGKHPIAVRFLIFLQSFVARRADRIIVPSQYLKSIVEKWGVTPMKITIVYNAFDPVEVRESKTELALRFNMSHPSLLTAGRLVSWKGMHTLIGILSRLIKDFPTVSLFIAGEGPERDRLRECAVAEGVVEHVQFLGRLSHEHLYQRIKAADLFVLNTGYEGFSHQLLEVMSIGTPIITTNVGGNPELLEQDTEGILVSYNNEQELEVAIRALLQDNARTERIVAAAQRKSASFTVDRMVQGTINALRG